MMREQRHIDAPRALRAMTMARGFTLIELMIVVVIMGVLASLAIYSVNNYIQKSKTTEPREVVGQIMSAQEAYFDEAGADLDVTGGVSDSHFYPNGTFDGRTRIQWGGVDGCTHAASTETCMLRFKRLGVFVNQPVMFRYASTTFAAGVIPTVPTTYVTGYNPDNVTAPRAGYVVVALSDLNGDGGSRTALVGSSLQAQLYLENVGD